MTPVNFQSKCILFAILSVIFFLGSMDARERRGHQKRIIGGKRAALGEYPFLASISDSDYAHYCGASLISNKHLLTAAHCFFTEENKLEDPEAIFMIIGEINTVDKTSKYLEELHIYAYMVHPRYDPLMKSNDIAIIRLVNPAVMSAGVSIVKYATTRPEVGTKCTVAGWGLTNSSGEEANPFLLKVTIPIVEFRECERIELGETHADSQLCAGELKGGKDSCRGDSGGPLVCSGILAGIVSYGHDCGKPGLAAIYTDVSHYTSWIKEMLNWDGKKRLQRMRKISNAALMKIMNGCAANVPVNLVWILLLSLIFGPLLEKVSKLIRS